GQAHAARVGGALHGGDDGLGRLQHELVQVDDGAGPEVGVLDVAVGEAAHLPQVAAGGEGVAGAGDRDGADLRVGEQAEHRVAQPGGGLVVEGVAFPGPVEGEEPEAAAPGHQDLLSGAHEVPSDRTISASAATAPWPAGRTSTGLRSSSAIRSAWSAPSRDRALTVAARASTSAGGAPRKPSSSFRPRSCAIISWTSSGSTGAG